MICLVHDRPGRQCCGSIFRKNPGSNNNKKGRGKNSCLTYFEAIKFTILNTIFLNSCRKKIETNWQVIFTQPFFTKLSEIWVGIPDPYPGSRRHKRFGSRTPGSATLREVWFLPMMVVPPFSVSATTASISAFVPLANFSNSNTPAGLQNYSFFKCL